MDATVKSVIGARSAREGKIRSSYVNANDLFYKDVSRIDELIPVLINQLEETINDLEATEMPGKVLEASEILLKAIAESTSVHLSDRIASVHQGVIQPLMDSDSNKYQVLPWIVEPENLTALQKHHKLIVRFGLEKCQPNDTTVSLALLPQMQQIADLILDGLRTSLESIHSSEKYVQKYSHFEEVRSTLLKVHMAVEDYEGAGALAEKYVDFNILVSLCYKLKDMHRLESYFEKYGHLGFCEFTFDWYVQHEKTKELIETFSLSKYQAKLETYMQKNDSLAWHHYVLTGQYSKASGILANLATKQESSVANKKFLLNLTKLARLAGAERMVEETLEAPQIRDGVNKELEIIRFQDELPDKCLEVMGFDRMTMRVLSISEIIDAYTIEDVEPDSDNYMQALKVSDCLPSEELKMEKRYGFGTSLKFCSRFNFSFNSLSKYCMIMLRVQKA